MREKKIKTIELCEAHVSGFGMLRAFGGSTLYYHGTPINKLTVVETDQEHCVQCQLKKKEREMKCR
jgi:hypothetical protein